MFPPVTSLLKDFWMLLQLANDHLLRFLSRDSPPHAILDSLELSNRTAIAATLHTAGKLFFATHAMTSRSFSVFLLPELAGGAEGVDADVVVVVGEGGGQKTHVGSRGLKHSRTLGSFGGVRASRQRLGVRWSSGAFVGTQSVDEPEDVIAVGDECFTVENADTVGAVNVRTLMEDGGFVG